MANYDIYVLEENAISLSGGAQLDGVTQGNGSHLNGVTITLNSGGWVAVSVTDNDDDFGDSDGSQRLDGPATLNGTTYGTNTVVEAEYGLTVSDGTNSWTLVGFNVNDSAPAYGTVEGLAVIGGPGDFPPVGVPLTVTSTFEGPNFAAADYATPICMAAGTRIATPAGPRPVEEIAVGDLVTTRDHGDLTVRWVGQRRVACHASFAPVRFATGAIGNTRPMMLSQQHRVLLTGWQAELLFGADAVFVAAVHLINDSTIRPVTTGMVSYHHLMLDKHAALWTDGAWTESLAAGTEALKHLLPAARAEVLALFPQLAGGDTADRTPLGYPTLRGQEALALRV